MKNKWVWDWVEGMIAIIIMLVFYALASDA